jgi:uridine kinase
MSQTPQNKAPQNVPPLENSREQAMMERLFQIFEKDSQKETTVVQSVSLFFWDNLNQWARQIAMGSKPFTIALSGPSGSGKSFIREALVSELSKVSEVSSFTQDNYYRDFEADFPHLPLALFYDQIDFDDPDHIRFRHLAKDLQRFKAQPLGSGIQIPKLRFGTPSLKPAIIEEALHLPVKPFMVTEGIHAFYEPAILPFYDFKIYVDIDEKTRRQRWLARNIQENRGITDNMWNTTVQCLERHISPTRAVADLVINNNAPASQVIAFLNHFVAAIGLVLRSNRQNIA